MKKFFLILAACSVVIFTAGKCNGSSNKTGEPDSVDEAVELTDEEIEAGILGVWTSEPGENQGVVVLLKDGLFVKGLASEGWTFCGKWCVSEGALTLVSSKCTRDGGMHWEYMDEDVSETWTVEDLDSISDPAPVAYTREELLAPEAFKALKDPKCYEMDEEELGWLQEGIGNIVSGNFS